MRGPINARDLPAWSDEEAFGDLWGEFDPICDLPLTWRFSLDPKGTGLQNGWRQPGFDDSDWASIEIKQFWERQGYAYRRYDGTAWYRTVFQVPKLPPGRSLYLAFGAVNDEASVYINGRGATISEAGRQGKRFLVEVTDLLEFGKASIIAVQVSEKGGLGGIWKNVKLAAGKREH